MINFDDITREEAKEHNANWSQILDHLYGIFIIGGSGSCKTNSLLNLTIHQPNINKTYFRTTDPYEAKH